MNEKVLESLMQLFAIISKLDGANRQERSVVEGFLSNQLNLEDTEYHLSLFDNFVTEHSKVRSKKADPDHKLTVRDSSKMLLICSQINEELTQPQKVVVVFLLFSLINADSVISPVEYDFLTTVADIFNISIREFKLIEQFALEQRIDQFDTENLLIIASQAGPGFQLTRYLQMDEVVGFFAVMRIESIGLYLVKYVGKGFYYLNGLAMREGEVYALTVGSTIRSSKHSPIYYSDVVGRFLEDEAHQKISYQALHVGFTFPNGKVALNEITLAEESGRLIGIMGPSGAGKSTLLEVLIGNAKPTTGQILINGRDLYDNKGELEGVIGYVPQDDLLIEDLTVFQNLYYAAKLSFGNYSEQQLTALVEKTLYSLGIFDIRHLKVGGPLSKTISGGERKRVNIGLELLRAPDILFLDEPTSGLSSRNSLSIMDLLKELTLAGKLVFVVIHQPSSDIFKMFDKLLILDVGGYPVYYGNPIEAIVYFKSRINQIKREQAVCPECGNVNPEQIFDIIESRTVDQFGRFTQQRKVSPQLWFSYFQEYIRPPFVKVRTEAVQVLFRKADRFKQFLVFVTRDFRSKANNTQYLVVNLLQAPLLALVLSFINRYFAVDEASGQGAYSFIENENIPVYFFMSVIIALFLGLVVSAEEIFHDRKILKREKFLNLSRFSYLSSKVVILFGLSAIQTLCFTLIGNAVLEIKGMTWEYWLVLYSAACCANLMGLNISSAFNSAVTIYIMIPILLIPQLILGGIVIPFNKINPWMRDGEQVPIYGEVITSRWAFEALMVHQFRKNAYEKPYFKYDQVMNQADYARGYLLNSLEAKLEDCLYNINNTDPVVMRRVDTDLSLLRYHLAQEAQKMGIVLGMDLNLFRRNRFDESVSQPGFILITKIKQAYDRKYNEASKAKNDIVARQTRTADGRDSLVLLKRAYYNEAVADLVTNRTDQKKQVLDHGRIVPREFPIYFDPVDRDGHPSTRAHFYAPSKHFLGRNWSTLGFNVIVVWIQTLVLFVSLYYNWPKTVLYWLSRLTRIRLSAVMKSTRT